jgi:hypothetical protein
VRKGIVRGEPNFFLFFVGELDRSLTLFLYFFMFFFFFFWVWALRWDFFYVFFLIIFCVGPWALGAWDVFYFFKGKGIRLTK